MTANSEHNWMEVRTRAKSARQWRCSRCHLHMRQDGNREAVFRKAAVGAWSREAKEHGQCPGRVIITAPKTFSSDYAVTLRTLVAISDHVVLTHNEVEAVACDLGIQPAQFTRTMARFKARWNRMRAKSEHDVQG